MDYINLAEDLEHLSDKWPYDWYLKVKLKEAAKMLRKQGEELKTLERDNFVVCPRCKQRVSKLLESGQCGLCDLMIPSLVKSFK